MYSYSSEKIIADLQEKGFAKLPSVRSLVQQNNYFEIFKSDQDLKTYKKNTSAHLKLIEDMDLERLFDALYYHGKKLNLNVHRDDRYFISRFVRDGQVSEGFRGHFDSHFITIVIPVFIPEPNDPYTNGELLVAPNFRSHISNEILNVLQKVYFKKLNTEKGYLDLIQKGSAKVLDFCDYEPLLFYGNRTFHGNFPLINTQSERLTFLCHLFDTSPRFGIGALLRKLRNR